MSDEDQGKVWNLVRTWSRTACEDHKAVLRENIRVFAFTRIGHQQGLPKATRDRARVAYERLQPHDPVMRHRWLFAEHWVRESVDETEDEPFDFRKRETRIDALRRGAMNEIWNAAGFEGVKELFAGSDAAGVVGQYVSYCVTTDESRIAFILACLAIDGNVRSNAEACLNGFIWAIGDDSRARVLLAAANPLPEPERIRLFARSPFQASTWRLLDELEAQVRTEYWKNVIPNPVTQTPAEGNELIDRLLEAGRPRAAFCAVHMNLDHVETARLKQLLRAVATTNQEPTTHYLLDRHYVSEALDSLGRRPGVTHDEMAEFEFLYIAVLDQSRRGIPNLAPAQPIPHSFRSGGRAGV